MRTFQILGRLALTLLCFALPQAAAAAGKIDKAVQILEQQARAGRGEFVTFLMGAASAYRWDSTAPEGPGAERLFCPPPWHTVDGKSYAKIALEEYRRSKSEYAGLTEYPLDVLSLALQRGLRARYPCDPGGEAKPG
ncbi:MAG TPA: hypothetical protein VNH16_18240 [Burkholderiales bacterium]|jgi:hypothetical protein|nr:hypothetical protein [Burkholderiales bacterium]